jgi:hypothetical protein
MQWLIKQERRLGQKIGTNGQFDFVVVNSMLAWCVLIYLFILKSLFLWFLTKMGLVDEDY